MAKKKQLTISQRLKNGIERWEQLRDSYPKLSYDNIEDHLADDEQFLDEFFAFVSIVDSALNRNYISKDRARDIINSISNFPFGAVLDAIPDEGIEIDGEVYLKKK